ncbi:MAG: type II toxin-antitoxin system PemK/MazF family toxin [Planctomycetes bacterium]|nr:type II toxin-antitoxin system PemK/MazF family toxin [Planctomycetota bacterium]
MRGEIWLVDFEPAKGGENKKSRPALVVSVNAFNSGPLGLVVVCPITATLRDNPMHVKLEPQGTGLDKPSCVLCDQPRSASLQRFGRCLGTVGSRKVLADVSDRLRILLGL